jgi:plasmid stability protein
MATITISDLDDALVEEIRCLAKAHNHPLEKEISDLLQQALTQRHLRRAAAEEEFFVVHKLAAGHKSLTDIANAIAALTPKGVPQTDSAILLREDRER